MSGLQLKQVHHLAIIARDYPPSRAFYCDLLGFTLMAEVYRAARDSWKGDLALFGIYVIVLFSCPDPPSLPSPPSARAPGPPRRPRQPTYSPARPPGTSAAR